MATQPRVYPRFEVVVKGSPEKGELGDCPFSQRTLITLEEKNVPYNKTLIDENNMPDWLGDVNPKKQIPVARDLEHNKWIPDSEKIVTYIEEQFPEPKLGTPDSCSKVHEQLMPAFMEYLKAEGPEEAEKEKGLRSALGAIEQELKSSGGPYLSGDKPCAGCIALAPKLNHMKIATKALKGWELPEEYQAIRKFMQEFYSRKSWKNTAPTEQYVIDGWKLKVQKLKQS